MFENIKSLLPPDRLPVLKHMEQPGKRGDKLSKYRLTYEDPVTQKNRIYETVSYASDLRPTDLCRTCSVIMLVLNPSHDKVLLSCEYRMSVNAMTIGVQSGKIDPGESPAAAATRELKEETGLMATRILKVFPPSVLCVGMSGDLTSLVIMEADGEPAVTMNFPEYISAQWATRKQVRDLMYDPTVLWAAHSQALLMNWAMEVM